MSILKRFADIMSANFNGIIDKVENPEKMIDQYLRNLEKDLGKVKMETANVMAAQKKAEAKLKALNNQQREWLTLAKKAVNAGNDKDAEKFTAELIKTEDLIVVQAGIIKNATDNTEKMLAMHDKLVSDMQTLKEQRDELLARNSVAKTAALVSGMSKKLNSSLNDNCAGFNRMKEKLEDSIRFSEALAELGNRPASEAEKLAKKYTADNDQAERIKSRLEEIKSA